MARTITGWPGLGKWVTGRSSRILTSVGSIFLLLGQVRDRRGRAPQETARLAAALAGGGGEHRGNDEVWSRRARGLHRRRHLEACAGGRPARLAVHGLLLLHGDFCCLEAVMRLIEDVGEVVDRRGERAQETIGPNEQPHGDEHGEAEIGDKSRDEVDRFRGGHRYSTSTRHSPPTSGIISIVAALSTS